MSLWCPSLVLLHVLCYYGLSQCFIIAPACISLPSIFNPNISESVNICLQSFFLPVHNRPFISRSLLCTVSDCFVEGKGCGCVRVLVCSFEIGVLLCCVCVMVYVFLSSSIFVGMWLSPALVIVADRARCR